VTSGKPSLLWVYGGSLRQVLNRMTWLRTASSLCKVGWQVTLVVSDIDAEELDQSVRIVILPRPGKYFLGYLLFNVALLCKLVFESKTDVILFHQDTAPFLLPIAPLRRLFGKRTPKIIMDSRTLPMSTATARAKIQALHFRIAHRLANCLADGQTAITSCMAQAVHIPNKQLLGIWPSAVDPYQFRVSMSMRRWPGPKDPLRLIYMGALEAERNLISLSEAVHIAKSEGLLVTLALIGEGVERAGLERYAREKGDGAIAVCPAVPYEEVPKALAKADVGVLPFPDEIQFRVSSPLKLFEYMAAGMPILATRVVCHTDVIGEDDYVFWAEDGSPDALAIAIRRACARKADLCKMGQRAAAAAQAWGYEESARKLAAALQKSLNDASLSWTGKDSRIRQDDSRERRV
jgi:glycosyltransferase involved in cell wall biosynthesis